MNNFGNLITEKRNAKNISQDELANLLHVSRQTISSWELGKTEPSATLMFKLCEELEININDFFPNNNVLKKYVTKEKKKTKIKFIFLIIGIIVFFLIILLVLLITFNSNKFKAYKLSLESDNYSINNGMLILSKTNNYFALGSIKINGEYLDEDSEYYIKIYELIDDKENLILATFYSDNIFINEEYGYNEYFADFDTNTNNLYLDISYIIDDEIKTETFKIKAEKIIESDLWFYLKHQSIGNNNTNQINTKEQVNISIASLVNNGYTYSGNWSYEKKIDNGIYMYSLLDNFLWYSKDNHEEDIDIQYYLNDNYVNVSVYNQTISEYTEMFDYYYDNQDNKLSCVIGNCDDYEDYLQILEKEIEKLMM